MTTNNGKVVWISDSISLSLSPSLNSEKGRERSVFFSVLPVREEERHYKNDPSVSFSLSLFTVIKGERGTKKISICLIFCPTSERGREALRE